VTILNTFATETILRYPSIVTIGIFAVGSLVAWGVYKNIIARLREDVEIHTRDIHELREWGEARLAEAVTERNELFVRKDLFEHYMQEMNRRLDTLDAMEIGAQLAEIKAMLVAIKEQINQKRE
jgi:hypothetical protein